MAFASFYSTRRTAGRSGTERPMSDVVPCVRRSWLHLILDKASLRRQRCILSYQSSGNAPCCESYRNDALPS